MQNILLKEYESHEDKLFQLIKMYINISILSNLTSFLKGNKSSFLYKNRGIVNFQFNNLFRYILISTVNETVFSLCNVNLQPPETDLYKLESLSLANMGLITNYFVQRNLYVIKAVVIIKLAVWALTIQCDTDCQKKVTQKQCSIKIEISP